MAGFETDSTPQSSDTRQVIRYGRLARLASCSAIRHTSKHLEAIATATRSLLPNELERKQQSIGQARSIRWGMKEIVVVEWRPEW